MGLKDWFQTYLRPEEIFFQNQLFLKRTVKFGGEWVCGGAGGGDSTVDVLSNFTSKIQLRASLVAQG